MPAVVSPISHNNMVREVDAHNFACFLDIVRQVIVTLTWFYGAGRVVMAYSNDGGIIQNRLLDDDANVHTRLRDASL